MATTVTKELLLDVLRDLMVAEAGYRSAMSIYKNHPNHRTRIKAEGEWDHAKSLAKCVIEAADDGQSTDRGNDG